MMEKKDFSFEKLMVYQKSLAFVNFIYDITTKFPNTEKYSLIEQFRRAAISVSLNIAEGYGTSKLEFKRYLKIAKGSIRECIAIINLAKMRKYIDSSIEHSARELCVELSKMLSGLIKSLDYTHSSELTTHS